MVWSNTGLLTTQIITNKSVGLYVQYFRMELLNAELVSFFYPVTNMHNQKLCISFLQIVNASDISVCDV